MANPNSRKSEYLLECNKDNMDGIALSFDKRKVTYEELHDRKEKYARVLYNKGVRQGDKVAVCCLNTPESVFLIYALDLIGAEIVGINFFDSAKDKKIKLEQDLLLTRPKMIITVDMNYSSVKEFEKALNCETIIYSTVDSVDSKAIKIGYNALQLLQGNFKFDRNANMKYLLKKYDNAEYVPAEYIPNEGTNIMFTGGSNGRHKGVELSSEGMNYLVEGMNSIFKPYKGMVHLGQIPIGGMAYGFALMHYALCSNMEYALTLKAMPQDFYNELVRTGANAAAGGPPHWANLVMQNKQGIWVPSSKVKPGSLTNLTQATTGGEGIKKVIHEAVCDALKYAGSPAILGDGLGSTETNGPMIANNGAGSTFGTLGHKISTIDIKLIDDETKQEVKPGQPGVLHVYGPTVMKGYYNDDKSNSEAYEEIDGKKYLNLKDVLVQLPTGEYKYISRQKRNFVSGCDNIYPEQIEELLMQLPEIADIVVTGITDDVEQFLPRYRIVLANENVDIEKLEKTIIALVKAKKGDSWLPGYIEYLTEPLKRMPNTKVDLPYYKNEDQKDIDAGTLVKIKRK